mmetsp:Transcript_9121/g.17709  ORF Transcript_9121/g.17709 Transcript_9121/m.17709 type:complete len:400 (-) Transcript_9121:47-1246(-)
MNQQQQAYYAAMRRSQDQMRRSHDPPQGGSASQQQQQQQRSSAPSNPYPQQPYHNQYTASSRDSRDSRGSRGSSEGLRVSSGTDMAGVGIFFQQEPQTGKVYVANIVPGGSADRSGVIRVNDVIVKVDDEDVQGQPLSTLRTLILGKQGSYVVLAFRRVTGTELYYFDVELVRGSPEYFESLRKSQAVQDEKDKLLHQVRQQEAEIHALKQNTRASATGSLAGSEMGDSLQRELQERCAAVQQLERELKATKEDVASAGTVSQDAEGAAQSIRAENKRLSDTVTAAQSSINELVKRLDVDKAGWDSEKLRMESQLQEAKRKNSANSGSVQVAQQENQKLKEEVALRRAREEGMQRKLRDVAVSLEEALQLSDDNVHTLQDLIPALDSLQAQVLDVVAVK